MPGLGFAEEAAALPSRPTPGMHPHPRPFSHPGEGGARAAARLLSGNRLHLQDGPIDLIIRADGAPDAVTAAYRAAAARFVSVLDELCSELPLLRSEVETHRVPNGPVASRMHAAVLPLREHGFITPMAAVAGSVAEEILSIMAAAAPLSRAFVNNGGDIALHFAPGESTTLAMIDRPDSPALFGKAMIHSHDPVRGVATSGWHGRSFSLGIADAVTVLARTAAEADAAATVIANAVDLPLHPGIGRVPARDIQPDNDLGSRLVTRLVPILGNDEKAKALASGEVAARRLLSEGCICAAALHCQGMTRLVVASSGTC